MFRHIKLVVKATVSQLPGVIYIAMVTLVCSALELLPGDEPGLHTAAASNFIAFCFPVVSGGFLPVPLPFCISVPRLEHKFCRCLLTCSWIWIWHLAINKRCTLCKYSKCLFFSLICIINKPVRLKETTISQNHICLVSLTLFLSLMMLCMNYEWCFQPSHLKHTRIFS